MPFQLIVVLITGGLFGVNLYGTLMLEQNFDRVWFFPPDSMAYRYTVTNSKVTKIQSLDTFVPEKRTNKLMVLIPGDKFETQLRDFRLCLRAANLWLAIIAFCQK